MFASRFQGVQRAIDRPAIGVKENLRKNNIFAFLDRVDAILEIDRIKLLILSRSWAV
jgi:hypothetical protein